MGSKACGGSAGPATATAAVDRQTNSLVQRELVGDQGHQIGEAQGQSGRCLLGHQHQEARQAEQGDELALHVRSLCLRCLLLSLVDRHRLKAFFPTC